MELQAEMNPKTKLVADMKGATKMIRVKTMRDICIKNEIVKAGQEIEMAEDEANEFLKPIEGPYTHSGYMSDHNAQRAQICRVQRIS